MLMSTLLHLDASANPGGSAARTLTAERAVGDISAVVDYSKLAPASRAIFYPIERRAFYGGIRARF